jgi:hypothetical protein
VGGARFCPLEGGTGRLMPYWDCARPPGYFLQNDPEGRSSRLKARSGW